MSLFHLILNLLTTSPCPHHYKVEAVNNGFLSFIFRTIFFIDKSHFTLRNTIPSIQLENYLSGERTSSNISYITLGMLITIFLIEQFSIEKNACMNSLLLGYFCILTSIYFYVKMSPIGEFCEVEGNGGGQ